MYRPQTKKRSIGGQIAAAMLAAFQGALTFTCKLDRSLDEVVDLEITPGVPIPRREWERYSPMIDDHPMHD
ncbi:hypothetical protein [Bosea beijingensis]|uniref:hypothetical protein n=1 Tax=Bosea beijingensis TaxID=3068632 RepID=UPI002741FA26|nr:hypothetical protein [Bosea sp. REN20]